MLEDSIYKELFNQYSYVLGENKYIFMRYINCMIRSKKIFSDNKKMRKILTKEIDEYFTSSTREKNLYKFLFIKKHSLAEEDIYGLLNILDDNFEERFKYIDDLLDTFELALDLELDYKFYEPIHKPKQITKEDEILLKNYAKGFNLDKVFDFLIDEGVFTEEEVMRQLNRNNWTYELSLKEIVENNIVSDEEKTLKTIYDLVAKAFLLSDKDDSSKDENELLQQTLSTFYELLYQQKNPYSKSKISQTKVVDELLRSYDDEPFVEQIKKAKQLLL